MLYISEEQFDGLRQVALDAYREQLLDRYRGFAPELFRVAGEAQFRLFVRLGTDRALALGLTLRGPMRLLCDVMCILGHEFDRDPQYRCLWPEGDPAAIPMPFAERLHANVGGYLERCIGPDQGVLARVLRDLLALPLDPIPDHRAWVLTFASVPSPARSPRRS